MDGVFGRDRGQKSLIDPTNLTHSTPIDVLQGLGADGLALSALAPLSANHGSCVARN